MKAKAKEPKLNHQRERKTKPLNNLLQLKIESDQQNNNFQLKIKPIIKLKFGPKRVTGNTILLQLQVSCESSS